MHTSSFDDLNLSIAFYSPGLAKPARTVIDYVKSMLEDHP
jgi:hypothetical protein